MAPYRICVTRFASQRVDSATKADRGKLMKAMRIMFVATYRNYSRVKSLIAAIVSDAILTLRMPLRDVLRITNTRRANNLCAVVHRVDYERILRFSLSSLSLIHLYTYALSLFHATTFRARNKDSLKGSRGNEGSVPRCLHFAVSLGDKGRRNRRSRMMVPFRPRSPNPREGTVVSLTPTFTTHETVMSHDTFPLLN